MGINDESDPSRFQNGCASRLLALPLVSIFSSRAVLRDKPMTMFLFSPQMINATQPAACHFEKEASNRISRAGKAFLID